MNNRPTYLIGKGLQGGNGEKKLVMLSSVYGMHKTAKAFRE